MKTLLRLSLYLLLAAPLALPASLVNDRAIETAARSSYTLRTLLEGRVKVSADFGVLTLTGAVEDLADKALAGDTAGNIPGVDGVEDKLTIMASHREHSDPWIVRGIRDGLRRTKGISAAATSITVEDGMVTLIGQVPTEAQKQTASRVAGEIVGVNYVRNNLVVTDASLPAGAAEEKIDDASVTSLVRALLAKQAATKALPPKVVTTGGVVRLTGLIGSEADKALVVRLVQEVRGVRAVTNELKIKG